MKAGTLLCATLRPDANQRREELARVWAAPPPGTAELIRHEGAGLWVHRRLTALGIRDQVEPGLRAALRQEVMVTAGTNLRVDEEARRAVGILAQAGIPVILIKGVARRALASRWPLLDARGLGDVDLLLPPDRIEEGWVCLQGSGYAIAPQNQVGHSPEHHHLAALLGPGKVSIELHRSSSVTLPPAEAWARFATGAEPVVWQGMTVLVPAATELAWHTISHAATDGVAGFRLRHWLDLVAMFAAGSAVNWDVIESRIETEQVPDDLTLEPLEPRMLRQWLGGAAALLESGTCQEWLDSSLPLDLTDLLDGRARLLVAMRAHDRFSRRLLVEWTRGRLGWPPDPVLGGRMRRMKGQVVGRVARSAARLMNL